MSLTEDMDTMAYACPKLSGIVLIKVIKRKISIYL